MKKNLFRKFFLGIVLLIASWLGAGGNVMMAAGTVATDSNGTNQNNTGASAQNGAADGGAASVTQGQQINPELYETDLEKVINDLDPMGTTWLSIVQDVQARKINSQEFEFYSIGPRIIRTTTDGTVTAGTDRAMLKVADPGFVTKDDTIRVVGVAGSDGRDLMLIVADKDANTGYPVVYAKNGVGSQNFGLPEIPNGTCLIRMGKSCSESTMQTGRAYSIPESEKGCVQNFMLQIEQTEFDRLTSKRVSWDFDDIVEWNMRDYKVTKELTYLFGIGGLDRHACHNNENNYTMLGIWWQAGRDIEIGHVVTNSEGQVQYEADGTTPKVEISGTDLVAFNKKAFLGNGGSQTKYLIAGANVIEAFDNIKGKQYETKDIITENNLTIQNFKTSFGTIKLAYDKLFDVCGMANAAFMLDKAYLRKVEFISLKRTQLKLQESGQRNSHGVVLQEVNAVYLQYADAHARVWLAGRKDMYDFAVAAKYENNVQRTAVPKKPYGGKPLYGSANFADVDARKTADNKTASQQNA